MEKYLELYLRVDLHHKSVILKKADMIFTKFKVVHLPCNVYIYVYIYIYVCVCVCVYVCVCGPGSSVGIATELRAGRSGIESQWRRVFPSVQTSPGAHPASFKMCTGSFPGGKCGRGVLLTTHPLLVPRSWKSRAIPLPTLWATPGL